LIWGRASSPHDSLPQTSPINTGQVHDTPSTPPDPDPPPSFPLQDMNSESLINQFLCEPQIVTCSSIHQLTCETALPRATGSETTTVSVGLLPPHRDYVQQYQRYVCLSHYQSAPTDVRPKSLDLSQLYNTSCVCLFHSTSSLH